jgi:hypothetical protein
MGRVTVASRVRTKNPSPLTTGRRVRGGETRGGRAQQHVRETRRQRWRQCEAKRWNNRGKHPRCALACIRTSSSICSSGLRGGGGFDRSASAAAAAAVARSASRACRRASSRWRMGASARYKTVRRPVLEEGDQGMRGPGSTTEQRLDTFRGRDSPSSTDVATPFRVTRTCMLSLAAGTVFSCHVSRNMP